MPIIDVISPYFPFLSHRSVRNKDSRMTYHPVPVANAASVLFGLIGYSSVFFANRVSKLPLLVGLQWAVFLEFGLDTL